MSDPFGVVSATVSKWDYDMENCPINRKILLLTHQGIAVIGQISSETRSHYSAWAPLPDRDRQLEKQLGVQIR